MHGLEKECKLMDEFMPMTNTAEGTAVVTSTMAQAKKLSLRKESNDRFSAPCPDSKMEEIVKGNGVSACKEAQRGQFESSKTWSKNMTANVLVKLSPKISWSSNLLTKLHF